MKQLTNYQRVSQYLVKIFKLVNEEYFDNSLQVPTISIQTSLSAYGHVTVSKVWHNNNEATHELNISAEYLNRPIENVVATIIHEASHLYAIANNIKDTSNNGVYHNKKFKQIAEELGHLSISQHSKYGWTITEPTEDTLEFCINNGLEDIQLNRGTLPTFNGTPTTTTTTKPVAPKKPTSTRKYICPCCGNSFRATKSINVLCLDCDTPFILAN